MPSPDDLNDPNVGNLGESPEAFELRRLQQLRATYAAERLNEAEKERPLRENFGPNEQESWDDPQSTHEAIAAMKAARAPSRLAAAGLAPPPPTRRLIPTPPELERYINDQNDKQELALMVQAVVGELSRELRGAFADLKEDIDANTRLLGVMNAPMEAITDSHERAASSFETLRRDIAHGIDTSPAIEALSKLVDNAGLSQAQSRAEARFEELAAAIAASLLETRKQVKESIDAVSVNMVQVLHLFERLLQREAREMKRRAEQATKA